MIRAVTGIILRRVVRAVPCVVLGTVLAAAASVRAGAAERNPPAVARISVEKPLVSADQADLRDTVGNLLDQSAALIARLYPQSIVIAPAGDTSGADYVLHTVASEEGRP